MTDLFFKITLVVTILGGFFALYDWTITAIMLQVRKRHSKNFLMFYIVEQNPWYSKWLNHNDGWFFYAGIWTGFTVAWTIIFGASVNALYLPWLPLRIGAFVVLAFSCLVSFFAVVVNTFAATGMPREIRYYKKHTTEECIERVVKFATKNKWTRRDFGRCFVLNPVSPELNIVSMRVSMFDLMQAFSGTYSNTAKPAKLDGLSEQQTQDLAEFKAKLEVFK